MRLRGQALEPFVATEGQEDPEPLVVTHVREAVDLTALIDMDDDRKPETQILQKGDVVLVKVEALSTADAQVAKTFVGTPGEGKPQVGTWLSFSSLETARLMARIGFPWLTVDLEQSLFA